MENEEFNQAPIQPPQGSGQALGSNAEMSQLREAMRNDPNFLQNIMSTLATSNPQLFQVILFHKEIFIIKIKY